MSKKLVESYKGFCWRPQIKMESRKEENAVIVKGDKLVIFEEI